MRLKGWWHCVLMCCAFAISGWLLVACGAAAPFAKTASAPSFDEELSSATVDGEEFTVSAGQAMVMYADHLPQAGGSGDETVAKEALEKQLKSIAVSPAFQKIPAVWGLINHCRYTMYVDAYYVGILRITVINANLAHQMVTQWSANNHVAHHYTSENEIPCHTA